MSNEIKQQIKNGKVTDFQRLKELVALLDVTYTFFAVAYIFNFVRKSAAYTWTFTVITFECRFNLYTEVDFEYHVDLT